MNTLPYDAFLRSIKQNRDTPHSFLLGAGSSLSSNILSASDCIWEWKKDIFLSQNQNASTYYQKTKDDQVKDSIQSWLDSQGIYPKRDTPEEYSFFAEKAYPIEGDRRKFFDKLISGKKPFIGYEILSLLAKKEIVKAIWTTNFDGLAFKSLIKNDLTAIEITLDSADRIYRNQAKNEVLTVALHGDYKYTTLKNTTQELDSQNETFIEALRRYHVDKNMVIIGYSGRDKSLMNAIEQAFCEKGSGRLYWCGYGTEPGEDVIKLLDNIRKSGREAYYIPTDGFDKTIFHIATACFENDSSALEYINNIFKSSGAEKVNTSDFKHEITRTDKYLKSNLHPIVFPKEVYQFEYNFEDDRPWKTIKELTNEIDLCAVPFKKKLYCLGTLSAIHETFGKKVIGEIKREPISTKDIESISAFSSLMLKAVLKTIAKDESIKTNNKDKLWFEKPEAKISRGDYEISIHYGVYVSLFFDSKAHQHKSYAFLSFKPMVQLNSDSEIEKEVRLSIGKKYLEKLRNKEYAEFLDTWNALIFKEGQNLKFEYPNNSGSGFTFSVSKNTAFAEIMVLDKNYRAYHPKKYDKRQTQHKGVQLLEPQLIFSNNANPRKPSHDFHPMRGLDAHKPYDYLLNGTIHTNDINLGVICGKVYSDKLASFLNGLNQSHRSNVNPDYLIDYGGFSSIYNIPINIPFKDDDRKWLDIDIDESLPIEREVAIDLARKIVSKIEHIDNQFGNLTFVVFIPDSWQPYYSFEYQGETFDLHDYIKAACASRGITTQLIQESTLSDDLKCQIYWWLSLSFYVKSFRTPWILKNAEMDTAYAGIGYSIKRKNNESEIVIGCSHIYNSNGQGLKYKLSKVDNYTLDKQSNPYLSYEDALQFGISIRELFYRSMNEMPKRVVIHKRTKFTENEIKGITESLSMADVQNIDLVEINYASNVRYFSTRVFQGEIQLDGFPLSRGTCMAVDKSTALLWTHGIVPSVKNPNHKYYLGGRSIPVPLKIKKHYGQGDINTIALEILGLTKMNWNSFDLYTKLPATIDSSNQIARIGKLLSRFEGQTYDYRLFI